jgi:hypothetical protein
MRGILRCCLFTPKIIVEEDDDKENDEEEIIEEKQFVRKGSAWMALSSDPSENPFDPSMLLLPWLGLQSFVEGLRL